MKEMTSNIGTLLRDQEPRHFVGHNNSDVKLAVVLAIVLVS